MSTRSRSILVVVMAVVLSLAVAVPVFAATDDSGATTLAAGYHGNGRGPAMGSGLRGMDAAAAALDMTVADLAAERHAGNSLAEIAASRGVSTDTLIAEMLKARETALDDAVAAGTITQEQADYMLEHMNDTIADHIDDTETGPRGGGRGLGGQGMRGAGGGICQYQ